MWCSCTCWFGSWSTNAWPRNRNYKPWCSHACTWRTRTWATRYRIRWNLSWSKTAGTRSGIDVWASSAPCHPRCCASTLSPRTSRRYSANSKRAARSTRCCSRRDDRAVAVVHSTTAKHAVQTASSPPPPLAAVVTPVNCNGNAHRH